LPLGEGRGEGPDRGLSDPYPNPLPGGEGTRSSPFPCGRGAGVRGPQVQRAPGHSMPNSRSPWRPEDTPYTGTMIREQLRQNLQAVRARIADAARRAGRRPEEVTLVAVTKRHPAEMVRPLVEAGAVDLGENYPQELWKKADELAGLPVRWHLI